ncbi:MAG TPA: DNA-formamidopyrimidine glycosylase family protein, partial [Anaerolineae bacterium]|nr:DNA-formamidopyrimidine glycosylase family protein [Anaerolineae bacterium]
GWYTLRMPELPELEVVKEVLQRRVVDQIVEGVQAIGGGSAILVRALTQQRLEEAVTGAQIENVTRRGKFLIFELKSASQDSRLFLALNPKLTGRLQLASPKEKRLPKTHLIFSLSSGEQLRYVDQRTMGQLYLAADLAQVPDYATLGPEPFDVSPEEFRDRLKPYRGEIKGVLIRGEFIAGIGNAYADEILWAAQVHPSRKRTELTSEEIDRLYAAMRSVLRAAIEKVRVEMGEAIHLEPRAFMAVHLKSGEPCPRCGTPISLVGANQRITNFCRTCQPGGLIKGM